MSARRSLRGVLAALATVLVALSWCLAAGPENVESLFQQGESAFRDGDTRTAERKYREVLEIDPHHLPSLLRLAVVVSWTDRLEESIGIYEHALEIDPGNLRGRLGLAKVESWTGDFDRAIALYEGVLQDQPGHREATLGLARTLSWADQPARARVLYGELLERDPADIEARNGLARTLSYQGRLDQALALYQESLRQEPGNAEALAGRARVYWWQGRSSQAWEALDGASRVSPRHREVLELREALEDSFASSLRVRAGVLVDSDDNVIDTQQATFTFFPALNTSVSAIYSRFDATQPCGVFGGHPASPPCDDPANAGHSNELATRLETVKGQATWRWKPDLVLSGGVGVERIDRERAANSSTGTASAGVHWRMSDQWSFSGSLARETFAATALTLDRGVGLAAATATGAWNPLPRLGARFTVQHADLSDGNGRNLLAAFARWNVPVARPRVTLTGFSRYLSYDEPGSIRNPGPGVANGYFSPDHFWANIAGCEVGDRIGNRFDWSVQGSLGYQHVRVRNDSDLNTDTVRGYRLRASYVVSARVSLEAWMGRTNLALQGPTGFTSTESGVALRWKTGWPVPGFARQAGSPGEVR